MFEDIARALALTVTTPLVPAALAELAWCIIGGALPGISASITMALLLPFTYGMDPMIAIVLLGTTCIGAEYGGSIPAILIRTPGTNSAAATVIDGYEVNRQGKAGEALGIFAMVRCLAGPRSRYLTGQTIHVNGGTHLP
jgi:putative tricarboxylic transport membrane protein